MRAQDIEIHLTAEGIIGEGTMFKGEITNQGSNIAKVVAWLKKSQYPSADWIFYLNEDVQKGEEGRKFTPKPICVKDGQYGWFCDGAMVEIEGLMFPVKGNVDFNSERKMITLSIGKQKQIDYHQGKGVEFIFDTEDPDEEPQISEELPF